MNGLWPPFGPVDPAEQVFKAVADFNRETRNSWSAPERKRSQLTPTERTARISKNKAARKARRQNRSK